MSVSWDQTLNLIWVVINAVSHIYIQWSMALVYFLLSGGNSNLTAAASASVLVK